MSSSLKSRILDALGFALGNFIIFSVIYKLFLIREDWLSFSIIWSISWAVGRFIAKSICTLEKSILYILFSYVLIIVIVFFLEVFILGVLFKTTQWKYILAVTTISFGFGLVITGLIKKHSQN